MNLTFWKEWIYSFASLSLKLFSLTSIDSVMSELSENYLEGVFPAKPLRLPPFLIRSSSLWVKDFLMSLKLPSSDAKFLDWIWLSDFSVFLGRLRLFRPPWETRSSRSFSSMRSKSFWSSSFWSIFSNKSFILSLVSLSSPGSFG